MRCGRPCGPGRRARISRMFRRDCLKSPIFGRFEAAAHTRAARARTYLSRTPIPFVIQRTFEAVHSILWLSILWLSFFGCDAFLAGGLPHRRAAVAALYYGHPAASCCIPAHIPSGAEVPQQLTSGRPPLRRHHLTPNPSAVLSGGVHDVLLPAGALPPSIYKWMRH